MNQNELPDDEVMGDAAAFGHPFFDQLAFWIRLKVIGIPEVHHAAF